MNKKYTLSELLSQCSSKSAEITEEQQAWLDMKPVGREVIRISEENFDHMVQLLETPPKPTVKLLAAAQGFRSVDELMYDLNQPQIAYTRFRRELRKIMRKIDETGPVAITRAGKIVSYCVSSSLFKSFQLLASRHD